MHAVLQSTIRSVVVLIPFLALNPVHADADEPTQDFEDATGAPITVAPTPVIPSPAIMSPDASCPCQSCANCDRLWLISTRSLTSNVCSANLDEPAFKVSRLSKCGRCLQSSLSDYLSSLERSRTIVIYTHGNRLDANGAVERALSVYRQTMRRCKSRPVDWVVFSWPASKQGILIHDFREKARRTDAQGLYLAWILRKHAREALPTALIGYSFGGRVVTGALHALGGGKLGGRCLPGEPVVGANFDAGLVAPAIESDWMAKHGYHGRATKNLDRLLLLYNHRDAVLKRYWLIDRMRSSVALGYTGPKSFARRFDGSRLSVKARDCAPFVGLRHDEVDYYTSRCSAGKEMAALIHDTLVSH